MLVTDATLYDQQSGTLYSAAVIHLLSTVTNNKHVRLLPGVHAKVEIGLAFQ